MKKPLIVIAGPTATGKTKLSVELAKKIGGEIISADSMQVYRYMDIGSAKVTEEEKQGIPHYLVDQFFPDETFNIKIFQDEAKKAMKTIYSHKHIPLLVGGTGFYLQSVIYDIAFNEMETNNVYRQELEQLAQEKGNTFLHNMLLQVDKKASETIHPNNVKRIIRALEYYKQTGEPISKHNELENQKESPYNVLFYVLTMNRETLYHRINLRVDQMVEQGLVDEVKGLMEKGYTKNLVSMQGLGYKEIFDYLEGRCSLEETIYTIKRDTRHFAKRQLTWFKRERNTKWIQVDTYDFDSKKIIAKMMNDIDEMDILL